MSQLIPFEFEQHRVGVVKRADGETLFSAADIARALGYKNISRDIRRHCRRSEEISTADLESTVSVSPLHGGQRRMLVIPESDVYRLIVRSKLPSAERFEAWVFEEVLPAIRQHGRYEAPVAPVPQDNMTDIARASAIAGALDAAARAFGFDDNMRLISVNNAVQRRTGVNLLGELGATHLLSPFNERYMTPTDLGLPFDMSPIAVNRALRDLGYQRQERDAKGKGYWVLTDRGREAGGRMMDTGKAHAGGTPVQQLKWPESVGQVLGEEAA